MKTKTLLSLAALAALPLLSNAQLYWGGEVYGISDPDSLLMHASFEINWTATSVTVKVTNVTDIEETPAYSGLGYSLTSSLTDFYLLKPWPEDNDDAADYYSLLSAPDEPTWTYADSSQSLNNLDVVTNDNSYLWFGASNSPMPALTESDGQATFEFTISISEATWLADLTTSEAYDSPNLPKVLVRWQQIKVFDEEGNQVGNERSGKGWEGSGFEESVVPEPSHIAALAFVGLGGVLFARRRLIRKQK